MKGNTGAKLFHWTALVVLVAIAAWAVQVSYNLSPETLRLIRKRFYHRPRALSVEEQIKALPELHKKSCPVAPFSSVQILSRNPQTILIEDFLTPAEAAFLLQTAYLTLFPDMLIRVSEPLFKKSTVVSSSGNIKADTIQKEYRDSLSAHLKMPAMPPETDEDVVISCIEQRAAHFQGHIPVENVESLQVVKSDKVRFCQG